ncbi:hypothetical protein JA1_004407 [Spathaspora sp. JA1]|nr:hypothetical protein JA1_004407 [Spathaspora sp. JA1]
MPPKIRVKGPRLRSEKVHITKETDIVNNQTVERYIVQIKLTSEQLSKLTYPFNQSSGNMVENKESEKQVGVTPPVQTATSREGSIESSEVRIPTPVHNHPTIQSSSDDDLSSLDEELNEALQHQARITSSNQTTPIPVLKQEVQKQEQAQELKSNSKAKRKTPPVQPTDYKQIPKNILPIVQRELRHLEDDEEAPIVDKIVFSLKDPLGASKIKLPVRSQQCIHFECFDYENFCIFNKITGSTKELTRKNLIKRNVEKLTQENKPKPPPPTRTVYQPKLTSKLPPNYQPYVKVIDSPYTSKYIAPVFNCPTYSCPICDVKFMLSGLMISDSYNYFVKSTPKETERIELIGMEKYRLIDDSIQATIPPEDAEDMIVLSDDDEEDERIRVEEKAAADSAAAAAEATRLWRISAALHSRPLYNVVYNNYPNRVLNQIDELFVDDNNVWGRNEPQYEEHGSSWEDPVVLDD